MTSNDDDWDDPDLLQALIEAEATAYRRLSQEGAGGSQQGLNGNCISLQASRTAKQGHSAIRQEDKSGFGSWTSIERANSGGPRGGSAGSGEGGDGGGGTKRAREESNEGEYLAALRGSKSQAWLEGNKTWLGKTERQRVGKTTGVSSDPFGFGSEQSFSASTYGESRSAGGGGACFKCGLEGHWAKDCSADGSRRHSTGGFSDSRFGGTMAAPDRPCPCGAGPCVVLTANTEKNKGRSFYKCPRRKDEGQCSFFEWCDESGVEEGRGAPAAGAAERPCPCGAGMCAVRTAKTEKNHGRTFYACPLPQGSSCQYFKWCDEEERSPSRFRPPSERAFSFNNEPASGTWGSGTPSRTARGAEAAGYSSSPQFGRPPPGSCYKCNQDGHWAKDCPTQGRYDSGGSGPGGAAWGKPGLGSCFVCEGDGHWAKDCPKKRTGGYAS